MIELKTPLSSEDIRHLLPHRWPFLLLDKVTELDPGKRAVGIKNVTINEPYFAGHFPAESIMPGVLIIECLAQLTAVAYTAGALAQVVTGADAVPEEVDIASRVGYLVAIKNVKFRRPVRPGDQLVLEVVMGSSLGMLTNVQTRARVDREIVTEGTIVVSQRPEEGEKK
ncbi:3-hydroxyacyl-ACP dehydratase FabZ [Peptococcaceae bacterium]|nr:3-hydroxyacyl-ACP dehydratase FabZ [Peptococcaceae bacterium]